jgi:glutaredoxin/glutathione-dependent peroxiredoxin
MYRVIDCEAQLLPLTVILLIKIVALQLGDKHRITTPVNWKKGDDVIVHPGVSNEEAKKLFPDFTIHKVRFRCSLAQR